MTINKCVMSGLSIFLWLSTKETDVSGVKRADVSKRSIHFSTS